jgi:D-serine deaminase-like pyridoxal phosphate-dependent protein
MRQSVLPFMATATRQLSAAARSPTHAIVGSAISSIETPALLVDCDKMDLNMAAMKRSMEVWAPAVKFRPHAKAHKTVEIALQQVESGACGVCCQKTCEAMVMAEAGVKDVLLSNEIVSLPKIERLARAVATYGTQISAVVDNEAIVAKFDQVAAQHGIRFSLLVDVNVGQDRCGVHSSEEALQIAQAIQQAAHLDFGGIQAYNGIIQHIRCWEEKGANIHSPRKNQLSVAFTVCIPHICREGG